MVFKTLISILLWIKLVGFPKISKYNNTHLKKNVRKNHLKSILTSYLCMNIVNHKKE